MFNKDYQLRCECGSKNCSLRLNVTLLTSERLASHPRMDGDNTDLFVIVRGCEAESKFNVVEVEDCGEFFLGEDK